MMKVPNSMPAEREPKKPRILVVDDDKIFCSALSGALQRRGYDVIIAHNIDEGWAEAQVWQPQRAIVDLRMPGESGLELIRKLKAELPEIQTIVLTGFGSIATAVEAIKCGAIHYLTKPISSDEVLQAFEVGSVEFNEANSGDAPSLERVEWEHLQRVLSSCDGNISEAARRLKLHRRTLQRKLARGPGN